MRLLENTKDFTLESLRAAAYDSYLPWFEKAIPALIKAYDEKPDWAYPPAIQVPNPVDVPVNAFQFYKHV